MRHGVQALFEVSWEFVGESDRSHYKCAFIFRVFAKSIREKATDMALGLVHPQRDVAASATKAMDNIQTPKHMRKQRTISISNVYGGQPLDVRLDIVLDTPVLVLPRSSCSSQVFVVHLGKISLTNSAPMESSVVNVSQPMRGEENDARIFTIDEEVIAEEEVRPMSPFASANSFFNHDYLSGFAMDNGDSSAETYTVDIRNINAYSLDTRSRKSFRLSALPRAEEFYSCREDATPVLYDTAIRLTAVRSHESPNIDLMLDIPGDAKEILQVNGSFIKTLNLSLSRGQYEQLLETIENLFKVPKDLARPPASVHHAAANADETDAVHGAATAFAATHEPFEVDAKFKRRLFDQSIAYERKSQLEPKVVFELPLFIIQLKNELNDPLIDIAFRDFNVNYERTNTYETNLVVSLRSLLMEDLLQPPDSKHRSMLVSSSPDSQSMRPCSAYSSRSCPNLIGLHFDDDSLTGSLPKNLESGAGFANYMSANATAAACGVPSSAQQKSNCPGTPPPSPQRQTREDNLVIYSSLIVDPDCPTFATQYKSMRQSSAIDFNSLDLIISVKSWFAFLNFFGVLSDSNSEASAEANDVKTVVQMDTGERSKDNFELEISVRSLTLVFVRPEYEIAKANVSNAHFTVTKHNVHAKTVKGRLGSVSLFDLTSHGSIYRERFLTSGTEALNFTYARDLPKPGGAVERHTLRPDALLKIKMSSVRYVHTKRFIAEIQLFVNEFQGLQTPTLIRKIQTSDSRTNFHQKPTQLSLSIKAGSPMILLPLSARSNQLIVADLGEFSLENSFHFASDVQHVISVRKDADGPDEMLDVMQVNLVNTDLFAGERYAKNDNHLGVSPPASSDPLCMDMGSYIVCKKGANLFNEKCQLRLIVERNLETWRSHNVPDFSVQGTLSRLEAVINLKQYQLVRGFLQFNLGEALDDLNVDPNENVTDSRLSLANELKDSPGADDAGNVWINMSITLDLQDVSVRLQLPHASLDQFTDPALSPVFGDDGAALACINFIKSSLKIDMFSDGSQDIDLVSQEILVTDSRFTKAPAARTQFQQRNVFMNILQPIKSKSSGVSSVQAEVHTRKRQDCSKYTILLNNMRVMAILDWLESVRDFLSQDCDEAALPLSGRTNANPQKVAKEKVSRSSSSAVTSPSAAGAPANEMEVILNITNSELVFIEKTDQWDSSAVILKSTTVLSFRPSEVNKVMSINLNHLEVFSCTLGCEEDTALSIIDPITINMDVRKSTLDIQLQKRLCIRLSYNDVKMFMKMLESLPNQTRNARTRESTSVNEVLVAKLSTLGFSVDDCVKALRICDNVLEDSALWLTQHAEPIRSAAASASRSEAGHVAGLSIQSVVLRASGISICVIDDCKDADVPLLELSFTDLEGRQELGSSSASDPQVI